jgi:serine/threonine-protein kinase
MSVEGQRLEANTRFGRYEVHELLARGGMGEVWLATAHGPNGFRKRVVLKTVLPELAETPSYIEMFVNEASLAAKLDHPNIVHVFELGCVQGTYFIAMEYLAGRTLGQLMARASKQEMRVPVPTSLAILASCCDGLQYAHDYVDDDGRRVEVLHRDMSPSNVMLSFTGRVTILDFGIATVNDGDGLTRSGTLRGKYHYMPPERICGEPADRRSDVYALGVVLYQLVTWARPFVAENDFELLRAIVNTRAAPPRELAPWVDPRLDELIMTAIAPRPQDRFPDAASFARALRSHAREVGEPVEPADLGAYVARMFPDAQERVRASRASASAAPRPPSQPSPSSAAGHPSADESASHITIPITERSLDQSAVAPEPASAGGARAVAAVAPPPRAARGSWAPVDARTSSAPSPFDRAGPARPERSQSRSVSRSVSDAAAGDVFESHSISLARDVTAFDGYGARPASRESTWPFARTADAPSWWRRPATKDEGR